MAWIRTFTGRTFDPLAPDPDAVDIRDIAHSLSLLCRFNGHCRAFYSVAQHAVSVSLLCPPEHALAALLHDAGEAYTSDLPRPVKAALPQFVEIEDAVLRVVFERYGVAWPLAPQVHAADDLMLATELRDLMTEGDERFRVEPLPEAIEPVDPARAEAMFLARFAELQRA